MTEILFLVQDSPEGGYEARALGHSIFTEADTLDELRFMIKDAVACHFEEAQRPKVIRLHFVREELLAHENATLPPTNHHRTLPRPLRGTHPVHHYGRARSQAGGGGLQPISAPCQRCADRPAHRQRHGGHVLAPVGGHDRQRRVLCRRLLLLQVRSGRPGHHRFQACDPHPSGPCGRAHPLHCHREAGRRGAQQHPLRHDPCPRGERRRRGARPGHRRGTPAAPDPSLQRAIWTWTCSAKRSNRSVPSGSPA